MQRRDELAEARLRIQRSNRRLMIAVWIATAGMLLTAGWMLTHPETIGAFLARIASGFSDAARG